MSYFFTILTFISLIVTLLPLLKCEHWSVRSWEFPRLQLFVLFFILFICELIFLDGHYYLLVIMLFCLSFQLWWIYPYTIFYKHEVQKCTTNITENIKIITANVLMTNNNTQDFISLVYSYSPDVIVTLESDKEWEDALKKIEKTYKFTIKCPLDNLYGMHLYSKFPLLQSKIKYLVQKDVPSIHTVIELPSKRHIMAHFLHPAPPSPTENKDSSKRDAELIMVAKSMDESDLPVIVTGDLNDVAWSKTTQVFRKISSLLDPRIGRGMFNTYNAKYWFFRWPLDHLFHSKEFTLYRLQKLPYFGSDHFAIFSQLALEPKKSINQESLTDESKDSSWTEKKLKKEGVSKTDVPKISSNEI